MCYSARPTCALLPPSKLPYWGHSLPLLTKLAYLPACLMWMLSPPQQPRSRHRPRPPWPPAEACSCMPSWPLPGRSRSAPCCTSEQPRASQASQPHSLLHMSRARHRRRPTATLAACPPKARRNSRHHHRRRCCPCAAATGVGVESEMCRHLLGLRLGVGDSHVAGMGFRVNGTGLGFRVITRPPGMMTRYKCGRGGVPGGYLFGVACGPRIRE